LGGWWFEGSPGKKLARLSLTKPSMVAYSSNPTHGRGIGRRIMVKGYPQGKKNATLTESIKHLRVWLKQPRSMKPWVQNPQPPPKKKKRWKYLILSFNMIKQALICTILITHQSKQKLTEMQKEID
jgi:hypothetical protein